MRRRTAPEFLTVVVVVKLTFAVVIVLFVFAVERVSKVFGPFGFGVGGVAIGGWC